MDEPIDELMDRFHARYLSHEFWVMAFEGESLPVLGVIRGRYYRDAGPEDFEAIKDGPCLLVTARKKRMLAYQLGSILRQMTHLRLSDREIIRKDVIILSRTAEAITQRAIEKLLQRELRRIDARTVWTLKKRSVQCAGTGGPPGTPRKPQHKPPAIAPD